MRMIMKNKKKKVKVKNLVKILEKKLVKNLEKKLAKKAKMMLILYEYNWTW